MRVVAVVRRKPAEPKLQCACLIDSATPLRAMHIELVPEHHELDFSSALLTCPRCSTASSWLIVVEDRNAIALKILRRPKKHRRPHHRLAVCLPMLFGHRYGRDDVREFVRFYRANGVYASLKTRFTNLMLNSSNY